jgi:hypothetical protein
MCWVLSFGRRQFCRHPLGGLATKPPWAGLDHPTQRPVPTLTVRISHLPGQGIYRRTPISTGRGPVGTSLVLGPSLALIGSLVRVPQRPRNARDTKEGREKGNGRKPDREGGRPQREADPVVGGGQLWAGPVVGGERGAPTAPRPRNRRATSERRHGTAPQDKGRETGPTAPPENREGRGAGGGAWSRRVAGEDRAVSYGR